MRKALAPVLVLCALAVGTAAFTQSFPVTLGMNKGPAQPIAFPHDIHAGKLQMDCLYCHYSADKSPVSNIPTLETCMGCHKVAAVDRPEIQKMAAMYAKGETPQWTEVYRLPDHVKFNHERHVKAGVECQSCHGPVDKMPVMYQYSSLKMGWCIDCHRDNVEKNPVLMDCLTCHH